MNAAEPSPSSAASARCDAAAGAPPTAPGISNPEDPPSPGQIGAVVVGLAAIAALSGVGRPEAANGSAPNARSVTVSGSGDVEAVPDRAGLSVGVSSDASTAGAALAANAAKAARVLEALRSAGVAKQDLQTQDVTVSPRWD